jgi:raffinose/stachyose/melibiose transport system substrate-binding protein
MRRKVMKALRILVPVLVVATLIVGCAATPEVVEKTVVQTVVVSEEKVVEKPVVQTVIVSEERVVEKEVVVTEVVEKEVVVEVTSTPVPKMIEGGPLEVGVLWEAPAPWGLLAEEVGNSLEEEFPGTKVTYTFNNTPARPAIELRWLRGDPLDVDFIYEGTDPGSWQWVEEGYLLDLTPYMEEEVQPGVKWKDVLLPITYSSAKYKGEFYAAPEQIFIWLLHYNAKKFEEWGLEPPQTWDDLLGLCEEIKAQGVAPIALSGPINFYVGMWYDSLVQRIVGADKVMQVLYGDGKLADDPGFLQAAQEFEKLFKNECIIEGFEGIGFTEVQVEFFQDKAAMILMGSWLVTEMKDSIPPDYQLGVATFPMVEGGAGQQDAMFGRTLSWSIAAGSDNPDLAVEYLKRFTADPEVVETRALELGQLVPLKGAPAPPGIPGADAILEQAANVRFILYNYGVGTDTALRDAWYNPQVELAFGKITPEEMIEKIDQNLEEYRALQGE